MRDLELEKAQTRIYWNWSVPRFECLKIRIPKIGIWKGLKPEYLGTGVSQDLEFPRLEA